MMNVSCRFRQFFRTPRLSLPPIAAVFLYAVAAWPATAAENGTPFHLFKDGVPMAAIVVSEADHARRENWICDHRMEPIPEDVPSDLARALERFQRDLRVGYDIELPLFVVPDTGQPTPDATLPNRIEIIIEDRPLIDEDRTVIDFPAETVMRLTGGESGVIRTLFALLEDFGGVRYLFQGAMTHIGIGAHFPQRDSLAVPRETIVRERAFPLGADTGQTTYGSNWAGPRNRVYWWGWEARLGTKSRVAHSHYLTRIAFPIDRYMTEGPPEDEDMFPILRGERVRPWEWGDDLTSGYTSRAYRHNWQPRYSSQAAVDEAVANLLDYLRANPGVRSLTLSVNDNGGHCETEIDPDHPIRNNPKLVAAYYGWVNAVAERITAEFPDVVFGLYAYREVQPPPTFKLHPNVVVFTTFDVHACIDPDVRARREREIREWAEVATIGAYFYEYGDAFYSLPRVAFRETADMIRHYHDYGAVAAVIERSYNTATEGPKLYLLLKLLEDPSIDVESTLMDWCAAAVGAEAAPLLRAYYAFWEEFWRTQAIHTAWWNSRTAVYLGLGHFGSYLYGLEPGDMGHCRTLMEQVVTLVESHGTADQRARAALLMAGFEWYEANAMASGAEFFAPDGSLPDAETAVALLRSIPAASDAYQRSISLPHETEGWVVPAQTVGRMQVASPVPGLLAATGAFLSDPAVLAELRALSQHETLAPDVRFLAAAMYDSATGAGDMQNLVPNSDFSQAQGAIGPGVHDNYLRRGTEGWETWSPVHGQVERSDAVAFRGTHALECRIAHENFRVLRIVPTAKSHTQYYFAAQVYVPADQPVQEGRLRIMGSPTTRHSDGTYRNRGLTRNIPNIVLTPGQWTYVSCIIPGHRAADSLRLRIDLRNFEPGDRVYIDDIQVLEIEVPDLE